MKRVSFILLLISLSFNVFGQNPADIKELIEHIKGDITFDKYESNINLVSDKINQGQITEALELGNALLERAERDSNFLNKGRIYLELGVANWYNADVEKGIIFIKKGIVISEELNDTLALGKANFNLGFAYMSQGDYANSLSHFLEAENYFLTNKIALSKVKDNISYIYIIQHKIEEAEPFIMEAFQLAEESGDSVHITNMYNSLGYFYIVSDKNNKAESILLKALDLSIRSGYLDGEAVATGNLSELYLKIGNNEKAIKYCLKSLELDTKLNDIEGVSQSQKQLAQIYYNQKELDKSIEFANQAITTIDLMGGNNEKVDILKILADAQKDKGNYKNAVTNYLKYYALKDSLTGLEKNKNLEELMTKYETKIIKKEKEEADLRGDLAERKAQQNKILFIGVSAIAILIIMIGVIYFYQFRLKKRAEFAEINLKDAENKLALERKLNIAQIETIKSQMNPHFLFNIFNSIQEFVMTNDKIKAGDYLGDLADLMRIYLMHSQKDKIHLSEEIEAMKLYLNLEKVRFANTLEYTIDVDEDIDTSFEKVPSMIIQPFLENAIKHGLLHRKLDRKIDVKFLIKNEFLICTITDNGVGREKSAIINKDRKNHQSFATSAIQRRIDLLNDNSKRKIEINTLDLVDDSANAIGTQVIISIPV